MWAASTHAESEPRASLSRSVARVVALDAAPGGVNGSGVSTAATIPLRARSCVCGACGRAVMRPSPFRSETVPSGDPSLTVALPTRVGTSP